MCCTGAGSAAAYAAAVTPARMDTAAAAAAVSRADLVGRANRARRPAPWASTSTARNASSAASRPACSSGCAAVVSAAIR